MNKKFSTLVASLLLAGTVGTVSAQDYFTKSSAPALNTVEKVTDGRAYQLSDGYNVLVMKQVPDGKAGVTYQLQFVPYYEANLGESLWIVKTEKSNNENGIAFRFVNLAYNYPISYDPAKAYDYKGEWKASNLGGEAVAWSWMRSEEGGDLSIARTPEAYITPDSVMTMIPLADGKISAVKYATKEVTGKVSQLRMKPFVAGPVWLNKYDLNTMLQTQSEDGSVQFSFAKGTSTENLWDKKSYVAVDPVGENTLSYGEVADAKKAADDAEAVWKEKNEAWQDAIKKLEASDAEVADLWNQLSLKYGERSRYVIAQKDLEANLAAKYALRVDEEDAIASLNNALIAALNASDNDKHYLATALEKKTALEADKTAKEQEIVDLRSELIDLNNELPSLQKEIEDLKNDVEWYDTKYKELVSAETACLASAGRVENLDEVLGSEVSDWTKSWIKQLIAEKGIPEDKFLRDLGGFFDDAKESFSSIKTASEEKLSEKEGNLADLNNTITEKNALLLQKIDTLRTISKQLAKAVEDYNNYLAKFHETNDQIQNIKNEIASHTEKYNQLTSEIDGLISEYDKLTTSIDTVNGEISILNEKLTAANISNWELYQATLRAEEATAYAARVYQGLYAVYAHLNTVKTPYWLSLKADANKYLMVDTAYLSQEVAGVNHLKFNLAEHKADFVNANAPLSARDINGRFNFRFFYYPTQDSMRIEADGFNQKDITTKYWANRSDNEIRLRSSFVPGYEENLVKVAVLGGHREVTVGSSEQVKVSNNLIYTINDRIGLNITPASHPSTLAAGLYYMDVVNSANAQENGARLMLDLDGYTMTKVASADQGKMNFAHMPAAKWVVEKTPTEFGGYPNIYNQETGNILNNYAYKVVDKDGKTYVSIDYWYQGQKLVTEFVLTQAPAGTEGYYHATPEARELVSFNYLNTAADLGVVVGDQTIANDTVLAVSKDAATKFKLNLEGIKTYGEADTLKRGIYTISVNDPNKLALNHKYVQVSNVGGTEMMVVSDKETATKFYLKEVNCVDGTHYYALVNTNIDKKAGVVDATGLIKAEDVTAETRTSAFAIALDTTRFYREFTKEELGKQNNLKFYRTSSTDKEYLYASENAELNLLAVEGKGDNAGALAEMTVIPTTEAGVLMPQYLIARNVVEQEGSVDWCGEDHTSLEDSLACEHTKVTPDTIKGEFLVNLKIDKKFDKYNWENKYTRVAFLKGYAVKEEGTMPGTGVYSKLYVDGKEFALAENKHSAVKFEFRLINEGAEQDFLIESESWKDGMPFAGETRPLTEGGWLKVQNGVPCIVADDFEAASQADVYNVDTNYDPTANEEISAENSSVVVAGVNGAVVVKGAEGKNVIVSTILGKVVANEVVSSDNAAIAAPAGVVVVSVDGESFKVVVK